MTLFATFLVGGIFTAVVAALLRMRPAPPRVSPAVVVRVAPSFQEAMRQLGEAAGRVGVELDVFRIVYEEYELAWRSVLTNRSCPPGMDPAKWEALVRRLARSFRLPVEILVDDVRTRWWERPRSWWWRASEGFTAVAERLRGVSVR